FGVDFHDVPFEVTRPWLEWLGLTPPGGRVSATLRGSGPLDNPTLDLTSTVQGLAIRDYTPPDLDVHLSYARTPPTVSKLTISDKLGDVALITGFVDAKLEELRDPQALRVSLDKRPFELFVRAPPRVLGTLPKPLTQEWPMTESADLHVLQTQSGPS